jgi:hypothetical protein
MGGNRRISAIVDQIRLDGVENGDGNFANYLASFF